MSNFAYAALAKIVEGFTLFSLLNHALPQSLDQGDTYVRVFFAEFFVGVDHNILVQELQLLGVHEATICWISSFLSHRVQQVRLDGIYYSRLRSTESHNLHAVFLLRS